MGLSEQNSGETGAGGRPIRIVIHGGAGTITRELMSAEMESECRITLAEALRSGYDVLQRGGASLDAVEAAIRILEDSPHFNAGKGSVFTHDGTIELDASIMDGQGERAGAVAAVRRVRNPIELARCVMERSRHVMLVGEGAEAFAASHGIELVEQDYFHTPRRWEQLQKALDAEKSGAARDESDASVDDDKFGTVGCVALDAQGNLAAGTSTGGMTNKQFGRVGDSPIIGAGTYASNATCAVSGTGDGEYFIRAVAAYRVAALMESGGLGVERAAEAALEKIGALGGRGGLIALDRQGRFAMPFNTEGMYRGYTDDQGDAVVRIFKE